MLGRNCFSACSFFCHCGLAVESMLLTMKGFKIIAAFVFVVATLAAAQEPFEPLDFNVTEALFENGIDVTAIPDLAGLVIRSSLQGCSIAVSVPHVP